VRQGQSQACAPTVTVPIASTGSASSTEAQRIVGYAVVILDDILPD
jgi:hypothetical protein